MSSEKIRVGAVGLGRGFTLTLPALRAHPRMVLTAAFDIRDNARQAFATEFGGTGHDSLEGLLANTKVDAVYIATPHELHAAQAIQALRAGKHVLVEKPMATGIADCAAMVAASEAADRVLMVGPSHGFDEPVRLAADLVASGRFGDVRMVTTCNFTDFMYRPRRPEELDDARGGAVYSQAAHQIDVVRRLVGRPVATIRAVSGNWDRARGGDGAYAALMTFSGGAVATLTYSGYAHYDSDEMMGWVAELGQVKDPELYGTARRTLAALPQGDEGEAKLARTYGAATSGIPTAPHHEHFGPVLLSCERADLRLLPTAIEIYGDNARERIEIAPPLHARAGVIDEFIAAICDGDGLQRHDGRWGLQTMACCAALAESSRRGTELDIGDYINSLKGRTAS